MVDGSSLGSVSGTVAGKAVSLSAGAKDIYVVVEDAAGNISAPLRIVAEAVTVTGIEDGPQSAQLYAVSTSVGLHIYGLVPGEWFSIYNAMGQLQFRGKATSPDQIVPLRGSGVYIVASGKQRVKAVYLK